MSNGFGAMDFSTDGWETTGPMLAWIFVSMVLSAHCYAAPSEWLASGPFGGAAEIVRTVPKRPNMVVVATSNGLLYQSLDGGASWTNRYFPAQFAGVLHAFEIDPRVTGTWYVGFESENQAMAGVYKTTDAGTTWESLPGITGRSVWALAIWPAQPDVIAAGTNDGVFLSRNSGASWRRISPDSNHELRLVVSLAFHPTDPAILYAGTTHLPWRTRDGGAHWESIHAGMIDDSDVFSIAVESRSPATVFASACSGVYQSRDGGSIWRRLATPRGAFRTYVVVLDPRHVGVVFAATSAGLLRTADSGLVWKRVSLHPIKSISFDAADRDKIYFGSSTSGILVSRDDGNSLLESNIGFSNRNFSVMAGSGHILYTATIYELGNGGVFRTTNQGATWLRMANPATNENVVLMAAASDDPNRVYAAGYRSIFRSTTGATIWSKLAAPAGSHRITALLALPGAVLFAGSTAGLFRLNGSTWSEVKLPGGSRAVELLQSSGASVVAAVTTRGAFRSGDAGESWSACGQPFADAAWYGLAADSNPAGATLAATSRGLYRSVDGCASWEPVSDGLDQGTVSAVLFHPRHPGEALAAQYGRILQTTDDGRSWHPLDDAGRNGNYPSALLILPESPQLLFGLFPGRGVLSLSFASAQNTISGGKH